MGYEDVNPKLTPHYIVSSSVSQLLYTVATILTRIEYKFVYD